MKKGMLINVLVALVLSFAFSMFIPSPVKGAGESNGWYRNSNGKWYYYESDGRMATDKWVVYDGKWCYLKSDGTAACDEVVMIRGAYYGFSSYYMISDSISWVGDYIYYFGTDGKAATGWYRYEYGDKKDKYIWYYFKKDGKGYNGWFYENNKWYYLVNGYAYHDVIREINNSYYCFDSSCAMITGWKTVRNYETVNIYDKSSGRYEYEYYENTPSYYYFDKDGRGVNGWRTIEGKTYYFKDGCAYSNCTYSIDGKTYVFNINASLASGWVVLKNVYYDLNSKKTIDRFNWYYVNDDGTIYTGWVSYGNGRYYVKDSYMYRSGWYIIDNKSYFFNKNGELSATA